MRVAGETGNGLLKTCHPERSEVVFSGHVILSTNKNVILSAAKDLSLAPVILSTNKNVILNEVKDLSLAPVILSAAKDLSF